MVIRRYTFLILLLLLLSGCTVEDPSVGDPSVGDPDDENQGRVGLRLLSNADLNANGRIDDRENRVLIIDIDGNIYTMDPDGARRQAITSDASRTTLYQQPTWSPNNERIAWTRVMQEDGRPESALVISKPDGAVLNNIELPFAPFYLYWSPDSERLAYLSNWVTESNAAMALRVVDLSGLKASTSTIAEGQPFYFDWSPDGKEVLSHIGNESIIVHSVSGEEEPISGASTGFPAPQWTEAGNNLIFAIDDQRGQGHLVMSSRDGGDLTELTTYYGSISFGLDKTARRLAYVTTDREAASATMGSLYLLDLEAQSTVELSIQPVLAFFWSPDGEKLAFLQFEIKDGNTNLRWKVWQNGEISTYDAFIPSQLFMRSYLAFFDQYALSMNIWSPDSQAFIYAGVNGVGRRGIFVQRLDEEKSKRISSGVFAAWSPN